MSGGPNPGLIRMKQIDYAQMLEVITSSDDPEATLAAFVMREVQVVSAELVAREQRLRDAVEAFVRRDTDLADLRAALAKPRAHTDAESGETHE